MSEWNKQVNNYYHYLYNVHDNDIVDTVITSYYL